MRQDCRPQVGSPWRAAAATPGFAGFAMAGRLRQHRVVGGLAGAGRSVVISFRAPRDHIGRRLRSRRVRCRAAGGGLARGAPRGNPAAVSAIAGNTGGLPAVFVGRLRADRRRGPRRRLAMDQTPARADPGTVGAAGSRAAPPARPLPFDCRPPTFPLVGLAGACLDARLVAAGMDAGAVVRLGAALHLHAPVAGVDCGGERTCVPAWRHLLDATCAGEMDGAVCRERGVLVDV